MSGPNKDWPEDLRTAYVALDVIIRNAVGEDVEFQIDEFHRLVIGVQTLPLHHRCQTEFHQCLAGSGAVFYRVLTLSDS